MTKYTLAEIEQIASEFQIQGPISVHPFPGRGNINLHTYEVLSGGKSYLLQQVNSDVFTMPHRVMNAMIASLECQRQAIASGAGDGIWEPVELVRTKGGELFLDCTSEREPSVWRLMVKIGGALCYKSLGEAKSREEQLFLAEQTGRGLAIYSDLTSAIEPDRVDGSLPGYRDTALYFAQFRSILAGHRNLEEAALYLPKDVLVRASSESHFVVACDEDEYRRRMDDPEVAPFIPFALTYEDFAMGLWRALASERIRKTLIHGDTKIENFLFCDRTGRVKSLVDLDTIMPFTWLADWGDLVRSMCNVAGEKERNLSKVVVDWEVYRAVAKGFLETSRHTTEAERAMMDFAVQAIALELGVRFLTDYLRGDTYFALAPGDPADLNKIRAMVQLTLCRRLMEGAEVGQLAKLAQPVTEQFLS